MPLTAGTRIGPYEIKSPLGEGGMGVVFRALDIKLQPFDVQRTRTDLVWKFDIWFGEKATVRGTSAVASIYLFERSLIVTTKSAEA